MNKQQLASKIWESANKMRSKIEANEYKDYILGFIFYKFLSETELMRLKASDFTDEQLPQLTEDNPDIVEFVQGECGYFIAYDNLFFHMGQAGQRFSRFPMCVMRFRRSPAISILRIGKCSTVFSTRCRLGFPNLAPTREASPRPREI
mgnify:CR=1 FL=1